MDRLAVERAVNLLHRHQPQLMHWLDGEMVFGLIAAVTGSLSEAAPGGEDPSAQRPFQPLLAYDFVGPLDVLDLLAALSVTAGEDDSDWQALVRACYPEAEFRRDERWIRRKRLFAEMLDRLDD